MAATKRIAAQGWEALGGDQMAALRVRAERIKGPQLEDWKEDVTRKVGMLDRPVYRGG